MNLLNSTTFSKLHFSEVLYSSKARYTLISIKQLNDAGFSITFANRKCIIHDADGSWVAEVFQNEKELHKLVREIEEVNTVNKLLTLNILYWQLGYILPSAAQKLIYNSLVTGLKLEKSKETNMFCKSYTFDKMIQILIFARMKKQRYLVRRYNLIYGNLLKSKPRENDVIIDNYL